MARVYDDGGASVGNAEKLRFLEGFPLALLDQDAVLRRLEGRNLAMLTPGGRPLAEAVWDAMRFLGNRAALTLDEFMERMQSLLGTEEETENHRLLQVIADNCLLKIRILSSFFPLVTDVEVQPSKQVYSATVDVVHLCGALYSGLASGDRAGRRDADSEVAWVRTPPAAQPPPSALSRHMQALLDRLSGLKNVQREDDFLVGNSGHGNSAQPKYTVVTRREALRLVREEPAKYWRCRLSLQGPHEGVAEPCSVVAEDSGGAVPGRVRIPLRGRRNCGMAFDGDVVAVCIFRNDAGEPLGGRVICVLESAVTPVNRMFLCRVSRDQATLMRPICGTLPKIHVYNEGAEEEYERTAMRADLRIFDFNRGQGSHTAQQEERARRQYASKCMVSVYGVEVVEGELRFTLDRVERIQRLACEKLFVVIYRKWNRFYFYPYGHVVGIIAPTASLEDEVALLRLQCQLPHPYKSDSPAFAEGRAILGITDSGKEKKRRRDFRDVTTFSIDNSDTRDIDDAISVRKLNGGLEVGVHITDVAHYVRHDSYLDREARTRAFSVYGLANETAPVHMFPDQLATDRLSLVQGKERLCLSVLLRFDAESRLVDQEEVGEGVVRSVIRSDMQMTKEKVTSFLRTPEDELFECDLQKCLRWLHRCTRILRCRRLQSAANSDDEDYEALSEVGGAVEAEAMVEELMVAANVRVARLLMARFPAVTPLRMNLPPAAEDVEKWLVDHRSVARHSGALQRELGLLYGELRLESEKALRLNADVAREVAAAVKSEDFDRPFRLLACERLHAQLLTAINDWHGISRVSTYQRAERRVRTDADVRTHFSLDQHAYVHFTSPLRRYSDLVVHRLLHAALDARQIKPLISAVEMDDILATVNEMESRVRRFKSHVALLSLYRRAARAPLNLPCPITRLSGGRVTVSHQVVSRLHRSTRSLPFSRLGIDRLPEPLFASVSGSAEELGVSCTWRQRLFIASRELRDEHPNLRDLVNRGRARVDVCSPEPQYYLCRRRQGGQLSPIPVALPNLLALFPGPQWGVLWKQLLLKPVLNETDKCRDVSSEMRRIPNLDESITDRARIVLDPAVTFSLDVVPGRALRVQFNAPAMRLARVRTPSMQYIQVCPSLGICLEHRDDPIACFASATGGEVEETRRFRSVAEYREAWLPLLRMETVHLAVSQGETHHIAGVEVVWMTDGRRLGGLFRLNKNFCSDAYRQIRPQLGGELQDCKIEDDMFLEFLCIRVDVGPYVWICHAGVKYCNADSDDVVRFFVVHQQSSPFPQEIVDEKRLATVEVIEKGLCSRYQEKAVALLSRIHDSIAVKTVLGRFVKADTGTMRQQLFLRLLHERKFRSKHLYTALCNPCQREAIEKAFLWQVSLIWGPPGTGKTITGVQITFWWAEFNRKFNPPSEEEQKKEEEEEKKEEDTDTACPSPQVTFPGIWAGFQPVEGSKKKRRKKKKKKGEVTMLVKEEGEEDCEGDPLVRWIGFPEEEVDTSPDEVPLQLRRRQILYCGPSNDCVNCVAEYLRTKVEAGHLSLVRVFSSQVEKNDFPVPGQDASSFQCHVKVPENLHDITLHRLVRQEGKPFAALLRRFDIAFRKVQKYLNGEQIGLNGAGRPLRMTWRNHHNLLLRLRKATSVYQRVLSAAKTLELRRHDVVLCTTTVAASYLVQLNCRFCQVIVDEAGMCTEAETLVPLSPFRGIGCASAAIENVVLIGDHKQLRPILNSQDAADRGLERSMLQRHWTAGGGRGNRTMLDTQYRMHPSVCEFPSVRVYNSKLKTAVSPLWTGVEAEDLPESTARNWTGLSSHADDATLHLMENSNANVLRGMWPGQRSGAYRCMPGVEVSSEEERIVFLHVEGDEESLLLTTEAGNENSKSNLAEAREAVRVYMQLRRRFSRPRAALASVAVLSQYQHQVHLIRERLQKALAQERSRDPVARQFHQARADPLRKEAGPVVSSVVRSQGSEYDYVILSTVRSLRDHDIDPHPTPGWEKKYLGFITDINQINVAMTRARRGLIIIGNGKLLQVHHFWRDLLNDLRERGCYVASSRAFLREEAV